MIRLRAVFASLFPVIFPFRQTTPVKRRSPQAVLRHAGEQLIDGTACFLFKHFLYLQYLFSTAPEWQDRFRT